MQPESFPPHIIAAFLKASRQHFGLAPVPATNRVPQPGRLRPVIRSLALIGSLGAALAQPALATEAGNTNPTSRPSAIHEECKP
jgi:hypothetical protein